MRSFWSSYGLFLAESLTVVVAVLVVVGGSALVLRRSRHRPPLQVTDLGQRYDEVAAAIRAEVLPRAQARGQQKALRAKRKAAGRKDADQKPRMFVLDFHGDQRASQVSALREEVTAVLSAAGGRDEVLVRLENPGGYVHDQGLAASQLLRIRTAGIPLTVAVDKVAASGGYLMASVADRIVAAPFAVVGSIGVVAVVPNVRRLLDRAGVEVEQFTGGRFKRTVTPYGQTTEQERAKLTEEIQDTHTLFKEFVRAHRPQVDVERVGTGEHWYGTRAVELGLVDELRTSDDVLLAARDRFDLYRLRYGAARNRPRRLADLLGSLRL